MVGFLRANAVAAPLSPDPGTLEGALMNNHMPRRLVSDPRLKGTGRSGGFVESLLDVARDRLSAFAGHLLAERSRLARRSIRNRVARRRCGAQRSPGDRTRTGKGA